MTITREHLAGLELALSLWQSGDVSEPYARELLNAIAQAKTSHNNETVALPEGIKIDKDFFGTVHINFGDFDFIQIRYDHRYTHNSHQDWVARTIVESLTIQAMASPLTCKCGDEYLANSYGAGFIHGSGMCENCYAEKAAKHSVIHNASDHFADARKMVDTELVELLRRARRCAHNRAEYLHTLVLKGFRHPVEDDLVERIDAKLSELQQ